MAYEQKDGQGSLFKNDKGGVESRPDLKGSITVGGKQYWLSAWSKTGDKGKWLSLSIQEKDAAKTTNAQSKEDVDQDIPW